ncbi:helix-turn-helix transcriptional regulator [Streptomyces boninensis]|uniref:helix-turn-helix transcriptional regulator n=1 Tax=Streptomyces boninensis TaxID=2039455 RepID=UPI003B21FEC2
MTSTDLGDALKTWRAAVAPQDAGLQSGGRRRTPGLRREELSQLAGISADYLTRLEQGRASNPSPQVIEALARALRLNQDERLHLFHLAGLAPPGPDRISSYITPGVQRMLERLQHTPVAVYDAMWTLLHANPLYVALMGEWHGNDRNGVWRNFLGTGTRVRQSPDSLRALRAATAADLRRTAARYPNDPRLRALIRQLRADSPLFNELWESGAVAEHHSARKTIDHPQLGALTLDCDVLHVAGDDLRLMVYTAEPGSQDAERLSLLAVIGTQFASGC